MQHRPGCYGWSGRPKRWQRAAAATPCQDRLPQQQNSAYAFGRFIPPLCRAGFFCAKTGQRMERKCSNLVEIDCFPAFFLLVFSVFPPSSPRLKGGFPEIVCAVLTVYVQKSIIMRKISRFICSNSVNLLAGFLGFLGIFSCCLATLLVIFLQFFGFCMNCTNFRMKVCY